jgi:Protein of unknown function (DUF3379)
VNCMDYRRALAAGEGETPEMKAHRLQCTGCRGVFEDHSQFERELRRALEVAPPAGFEHGLARVVLQQRRRFLAAAGVGALAVGIGGYAWFRRPDPLALACIEFVMKEEAKSIMMGSMPRAQAEQVLASTLPLGQVERVGRVRHIGPCPFQGATAYHVVLEVPQGKVTLLIMPEGRTRTAERAARDGLYSSVVPLARGSVGVIGTDPEVVDSVAGALRA